MEAEACPKWTTRARDVPAAWRPRYCVHDSKPLRHQLIMDELPSRWLAPRWGALARVITLVALGASCLTVAGTSAEAANLEQHSPVTYNMQGASADTTPKWSSDIPGLLNHDVIALQEAGP